MPSGLRELLVTDATLGLTFPAVVQYPTDAAESHTQIGPYVFEAGRDAPIAPGVHPLVLLSHGSGGSHLLYRTIATHLARHGYVVVAPEHPGNNRRDNALVASDQNALRRPRHASLAIDAVLADPFFRDHVTERAVAGIGHSIGAYTILAMAGGHPWSRTGEPLAVPRDARIGAAVLLAPATEWFIPPDALRDVTIPLLLVAGDEDDIAPRWHSEIVLDRIPDRARATLHVVERAGHYSFLSPFPPELRRATFAPSTDPVGFDRERFHVELPALILAFLDAQG